MSMHIMSMSIIMMMIISKSKQHYHFGVGVSGSNKIYICRPGHLGACRPPAEGPKYIEMKNKGPSF